MSALEDELSCCLFPPRRTSDCKIDPETKERINEVNKMASEQQKEHASMKMLTIAKERD